MLRLQRIQRPWLNKTSFHTLKYEETIHYFKCQIRKQKCGYKMCWCLNDGQLLKIYCIQMFWHGTLAFGIVVQCLFLTIHMKAEPVKSTCKIMLPYWFFSKVVFILQTTFVVFNKKRKAHFCIPLISHESLQEFTIVIS